MAAHLPSASRNSLVGATAIRVEVVTLAIILQRLIVPALASLAVSQALLHTVIAILA